MAKKRKRTPKKKRRLKKSVDKESLRIKRLAIVLLALAFIGGTATFIYFKYLKQEPDKFVSDKYFIKGIDISHHQPVLDWRMVVNQQINFAYIKATEGVAHEDRNYDVNYNSAREAGIYIGSYHFYSFGVSGKEQAKHFIRKAKCHSNDLIPAIDVEHSRSNPYSTDSIFNVSVKNELKILENTLYDYYGVRPIIYTNRECYSLYIRDLFPDNFIWICDLYNEPVDDVKNWRIWQFSHKGQLPGVRENVDLNYYRYSFREFKELLLP